MAVTRRRRMTTMLRVVCQQRVDRQRVLAISSWAEMRTMLTTMMIAAIFETATRLMRTLASQAAAIDEIPMNYHVWGGDGSNDQSGGRTEGRWWAQGEIDGRMDIRQRTRRRGNTTISQARADARVEVTMA